ncbi:DUF2867 domain-containing protein [Nocardia sp. NPDC127579]|uniref:DUF2867 domain-containing protein n=1 Tax=Nocardia sp. NPDC127579 TaxID=3345402 RepID=UPI0036412062
MRLPDTAHTSQPWRVHDIAADFILEDVWRLPTPGGPDGLARYVRLAGTRAEHKSFTIEQLLLTIRWKLGGLLGWDEPETAIGTRVSSLRDRLPADLRDGERGPDIPGTPFTSVYLTDREWLAEFANKTVHGLMHISWVPGDDGYHAQMAALVKPNGRFGTLYMAAIKPIRHLLVYPSMMRTIERRWLEPDTPETVA